MFARNTLWYWLCEIEGIDQDIAARIIKIDQQGANPVTHFPGLEKQIQMAYDGLYSVLEDC